MTPYTPPAPSEMRGMDKLWNEAQLRSEVERIRMETVEECAMKMESQHTWLTNVAAANIIRSLK